MRKLTILVDMDDTIECLTDAWLAWLNMEYGLNRTKDDIKDWDFAAVYPEITKDEAFKPLSIPEFWDTVYPMPWAFEIMCRLRSEGHEIYIVTSSAHNTIYPKMEKVLFRYFSFIDWDHVIIATNKKMICGDILIDDAPHNLEGFDGVKILMTAPHNRTYDAEKDGMIRINSWTEVYDLVLHEALKDKRSKSMGNSVILYTTGCPKCRILEMKLDSAGVAYDKSTDVEEMQALGMLEAPALMTGDGFLNFSAACKWADSQKE